MVFAIAAMRKFLPHSPLFSHMMLEPPSGQELEVLSQREALVRFEHLVGQQGTATTPLTPAGKARFGDELVDVLSSGEFIPRGSDVEVTEVHGNRIVVRAIG
jgi:membrane-bound ClpP family serine protease